MNIGTYCISLFHFEKPSFSSLCCAFCSKNANNSESEVVLYELDVAAMADVILQG